MYIYRMCVFCAELFKETGILKLLLCGPRLYAADVQTDTIWSYISSHHECILYATFI